MAVKKFIVSFVGAQDPVTKQGNDGPILSLLEKKGKEFYGIILFYTPYTIDKNSGERKESGYKGKCEELKSLIKEKHKNLKVITDCGLENVTDPTDYAAILDSLRKNLPTYCPGTREISENGNKKVKCKCEYTISIASGTPQIHSCWLLLTASGEFSANIFHVREKGFSGESVVEINPRSQEFPMVRRRIAMKPVEDKNISEDEINETIEQVNIIGNNEKLKTALNLAARAARYHNASILITGETGTGKELIFKFIHKLSKRPVDTAVCLNCSAFSAELLRSELFGHVKGAFTGADKEKEGLVKVADRGSLFLDEIGDMPKEIQAQLLRFLQSGEYFKVGGENEESADVRVIAATNRILYPEEIDKGNFRADLYFRLSDIEIHLPPLRDRKDDMEVLAMNFLGEFNAENGSSKEFKNINDVINVLGSYDWPGNIRELKQVINRACIMSDGDDVTAGDVENSLRRVNTAAFK